MKTPVLYSILLLSLLSCSPKQQEKERESEGTIALDAVEAQEESQPQSIHQPVTEDFMQLVDFIDSSGYIFNRERYQKIYSGDGGQKEYLYNGKLFYQLPTIPFSNRDHIGIYSSMDESDLIDSAVLRKATGVVQYHFEIKQPSSNLRPDGLVEEWTCPSAEIAREIGEELGAKEFYTYINRGAYICYKDRYVYVFHSRSAGFYTPLKNFFEYFLEQTNAIAANNGALRVGY